MFIDWLVSRAKRNPYFDIPGYLHRWWLVPPMEVQWRSRAEFDPRTGASITTHTTDGTGPVSWRSPIAWVLQRFGVAVRIHEILSSDDGLHPHDHPWPFITIILRGGYFEQLYDFRGLRKKTKWHGPGSVLIRRAHTLHRLAVRPGGSATTLFITGRKCNKWGFNVMGQKIEHQHFDAAKDALRLSAVLRAAYGEEGCDE